MKKILAIVLSLISLTVLAGGDHFPIKILEISSEENDFSFKAKPILEERKWMDKDCTEITVKGTYDDLMWLRYNAPMSKEKHMISIKALKNSQKNGSKIYFGYIGGGLHKVSNCSYESKGLIFENENVYSIYTSI
jgi:hypothetical protein